MTAIDLSTLLEQAITERNDDKGKGGAAKTARLLGIHESALSQFRKGTYPAPDAIRRRIREVLGGESVTCPELSEITLAECASHKKRGPTTDSFYARIYRACQGCTHKGGNKP